jgi:hypothetical protein
MSFLIDNDNNIIQSAAGNNVNLTLDPQTGYGIVLGTGGLQLPAGTTAQEPAAATTAIIRYNTTLGLFEGYNINLSTWKQFQNHSSIEDSLGALATSGVVVNNAGTISAVTITAGTGITVANGSGVAGNPTISLTSPVAVSLGGTGLTTTPTNGQLLVGNGTNYTLANITGSTGLSVTNGAGTIALANTGVTSNVAGTGISVSGATGAVTIANTGVLSAVAGTGISVSGGTGNVTIANTGVLSVVGTANDITASTTAGAVTLDLATVTQGTGSTFAKITLDTKGRVTGNTAVVQSDLTGLLSTYYLPTAGGTMTGAINMGSNQINNLAMSGTPAQTDAVNVAYVQNMVQGLSWKQEVQAATTGPITLSGLQTIDTYTTLAGDRILVKNQGNAADNGIYLASTGAWTRSLDANTGAELISAAMFVSQGSANLNTAWVQTDGTITLGSSNVVFAQFAGAGSYTAGTGLTLTGTVFSVTTNGITNSLFRQSAPNTIVGNPTGSTANVTDITLGSTLTFVSGTLQTVAMTGDVTSSANSFATTVAKIQGTVVSGTTGSGNVVFSTSPVLTTPSLGAATGTSLTLSGLTAKSFVYSGVGGLLTTTAAPTNGQLLIGSTGAVPVAAALTAGTAISVTNGAGSITIANTGVTSAVAGTGISVSSGTGAVTIANTGVTSITGTANQITASTSTGAVTLSLPASLIVGAVSATGLTDTGLTANSFLYSGTGGLLTTTAAPTNGQILIGSTGAAPVAAALTAGSNITITNTAGAISIATTGVQTSLQLYKENPSSPTALVAAGTNSVSIGSGASSTATNALAFGANSSVAQADATGFGVNAQSEWVFEHAFGAPIYAAQGDAKTSVSVATCQTTTNAATEIGFNITTGAPTSFVVPAINSTYFFEVIIVARRTDVTGTRYCEKLEFVFDKGATAASSVIVGAPLTTIIARDPGANQWSAAISADATNGRPAIKVTGATGSTIRWVAQIRAVKVT